MSPALVAVLVALSGGLGAVARFVLDGVLRTRLRWVVPAGTLVINVSGSLLLGVLTGITVFHAAPDDWRIVLGTGFLGGYTTFSTASFETARLVIERKGVASVVNSLGMLVLTLVAAAAGLALASL
ncbi:fluoride efflux transporter CrcB [Humibacter sp.]|jgi:CrcB protein|uniref:fluoride efflux transporter CrcB n=1 Tax=Humibacter sp. TaxID=1940291 RepID=UPI002BC2AF2D|nr:fluoride efflux transporter CrcB [Humibacter sp.]HVX06800.1 fluoride efflux transporter CrcB [Humibacter sp.]